MDVMIFGAGYSGKEIAKSLRSASTKIAGTTRNIDKFAVLTSSGIEPYQYSGGELSDHLIERLQTVTHLVQSIGPDTSGDLLVSSLNGEIKKYMPQLKWIGYLSTVGVYGDHAGQWVTESTPCNPMSRRSKDRLKAEEQWQECAKSELIPLSILRLSGIYGPNRNAFRKLINGTARILIKEHQVFNRIRVEDIARAVEFLGTRQIDGIYNVTDDEPCPPQDVIMYAAKIMGTSPPSAESFQTATLTPMARSFYGENKRVSNNKMKNLGFQFAFPNYRNSLDSLWEHKCH